MKGLALKIQRIIQDDDYEEIITPLGPLDVPLGYMREEEMALYSLWLRIGKRVDKIILYIEELERIIEKLSQPKNVEILGLLSSKVCLKDIYWQQVEKIASDQPVLFEQIKISLNKRLGKGIYYFREKYLVVRKMELTPDGDLISYTSLN